MFGFSECVKSGVSLPRPVPCRQALEGDGKQNPDKSGWVKKEKGSRVPRVVNFSVSLKVPFNFETVESTGDFRVCGVSVGVS